MHPLQFRWWGAYQIPGVVDASGRPTAVQFGSVLQIAYKPSGSNSVAYVYFDPGTFSWSGPFPVPSTAAVSSPSMTVHNGSELQIGYQVGGTGTDLQHIFFKSPLWNGPYVVGGTSSQTSEPSLTTDYQ